MYQSQVRPDRSGRELVAQQQPKQHPSSPRNHRSATQTSYSFPKLYWLTSGVLRSCMLAVGSVLVVAALSACGGVTFRDLAMIKGATGTSSTASGLSQISCGTQSLTGAQTKACSVYLSGAGSSTTKVNLSSSNTALQVPRSVTIAAGATSTGFDIVSSAVTKTVSVTITGTTQGVTKTLVITLYPPTTGSASLSNISCGTQTLTGPTTKACSVYLTSAASSPVVVALSSNNSALQVPSSVTVPSGASTGGFSVTASAVTTTQTATLTASLNGGSLTDAIQLQSSTQPTTQHQVDLNWDAPASTPVSIAGYHVYRAISGSSYQLLNSTLDASTTYTDTAVQSGQTYDYIVKSVDSAGIESAPSNETIVAIP